MVRFETSPMLTSFSTAKHHLKVLYLKVLYILFFYNIFVYFFSYGFTSGFKIIIIFYITFFNPLFISQNKAGCFCDHVFKTNMHKRLKQGWLE